VTTADPAPDLGSRYVRGQVRDRTLHLVVDRPDKRNAFTQDAYRAIKRAAIWADRQATLDSVCLTGTGEWFGSGGDLSRLEDAADLDTEWDGLDHHPFRHIERCGKIWVARINGLCHAGGLDLALHCDVTIASDRSRFRVPELLRGLPDPYIWGRLVDTVGLARARWLIFTAGEIDATAAGAMGLVGEVVPPDQLDDRVGWALEQVSRTGPSARATMKREINRRLPVADVSLFSQVDQAEMIEGMRSFVEKRDPDWAARSTGR
jgi:enoyl-CoA hydratase/carnithine racemase